MMDGTPVYSKMNDAFLLKLDECRHLCGISMSISSSYRTRKKNMIVGGSPSSYHLHGRAVDILISSGSERAKIIGVALGLGLSVGIMENALHLDDRPDQVVFHYYAKYYLKSKVNGQISKLIES
jgi:hypothetical protein